MAILRTEKLTFSYPGGSPVLTDITFSVEVGEFVVLCGGTGSGKTTLLRQLKKEVQPAGILKGEVYFKDKKLIDYPKESFSQIGMVFQDPDSQMVMDSVWHELAFSLENQGVERLEMRKRIAEMVSFFGIEDILEKSVHDLSGGEKQMVNLASVLLLKPEIILLDEPLSQLDPIAAKEFLHMIKRLNDEFSITVIIVEHHLDELFASADKIYLLEQGKIKYQGDAQAVCRALYNDEQYKEFVPLTAKIFFELSGSGEIPFTVKSASRFLQGKEYRPKKRELTSHKDSVLECSNIFFRYLSNSNHVLEHLNLTIYKGEFLSLMGGNGAGKTTLFKIFLGLLKPQRGSINYNGKKMKKNDDIGYLAQNPILHFTCDTLYDDIYGYADKINVKDISFIDSLVDMFGLRQYLNQHPYDLSGGQQQKAALITVLLKKPKVLLLDEPTKGMDPLSKKAFGEYLTQLNKSGVTIVMITHDIEFSYQVSDRCAMLFDKNITSILEVYSFYQNNYFYTTTLNKVLGGHHEA